MLIVTMQNVILLAVFVLNVFIFNGIMLNVVEPLIKLFMIYFTSGVPYHAREHTVLS
jgi:hypothetical protein